MPRRRPARELTDRKLLEAWYAGVLGCFLLDDLAAAFVQAHPAAVRASGEETCDMVAPAMKKREFNFTEATRF
jgi:hypothetical protein